MSIVNVIDRITEWVQQTICPKILLKMPPKDFKEETSENYNYQLIHPAAFGMYVPTSDRLPADVQSSIPSVCIQMIGGEDYVDRRNGLMEIQLAFSTWDNGENGKDIFIPVGKSGKRFQRWEGAEAERFFLRSGTGWRDVWNFVDIAILEIENANIINGIIIDKTSPVKYGPLMEQNAIADYHPFWFAWLSFKISFPLNGTTEKSEKYL